MFYFKKNIMNYNSISPHLRLPFSTVRGTYQQRQQKALKCVEKLYKDLLPKFKRGKVRFEEVQTSVDNVLENRVNLHVINHSISDEYGGQDVSISEFSGKLSALTLELEVPKKGFFRYVDLTTIIHEFQHVVDQLFHPKFLARYQYMSTEGQYTSKYNRLYDDVLYVYEAPRGKKDRAKIIKNIEYKIRKFLRRMPVEDKINYIQDAKYFLISEDNAYRTQYKYAKRLDKKHIPVLAQDLEYQNKQFMFKEKIDLLTKLGFEIIQKERKKMARMPKIKMYEEL